MPVPTLTPEGTADGVLPTATALGESPTPVVLQTQDGLPDAQFLKRGSILCLAVTLVGMMSWEIFWRARGEIAIHDDTRELFAETFHQIHDLEDGRIVVLGSSRAHFDIQSHIWEQLTGSEPLMLAQNGSQPLVFFRDVLEQTSFRGTIVLEVTPMLFFSPDSTGGWNRAREWSTYYRDRTWAQRLSHRVDLVIQPIFAFLDASESYDAPNLKAILSNAVLPDREGIPPPYRFPRFGHMTHGRNFRMSDVAVTDTLIRNAVRAVWARGGWTNPHKERREEVITNAVSLIHQYTAEGGKVILSRFPSTGPFREFERNEFPRELYWDELVQRSQVPAYHFEDYPQLAHYDCPEWSHLTYEDAITYTQDFVRILARDGHLDTLDFAGAR